MTEIALRPVTAADEEFLRAVYASTRAEELLVTPWSDEQKAAFCAMQFAAQTDHYAKAYPGATHDVIVVDGEDAGRLYVHRGPEDIRVVDISILPAFRGRGVGGELLSDVIAEARESGRTVSIHVEHQNRAKHLYERLGFVGVEDTGVYLLMELTPEGVAPS